MLKTYQSMVNESIPLTKYMDWNIQSLSPFSIQTQTQLTPNINVHGTAYAGSIYAAAMATGWTLLKCWYDAQAFEAELVAAEANIKYKAPVTNDFECSADLNKDSVQYKKLTERMQIKKSCGFPLTVEIKCESQVCAILEVNFVFKC